MTTSPDRYPHNPLNNTHVDYINIEYSNGANHTYGIREDGKKDHISAEEMLVARGYDPYNPENRGPELGPIGSSSADDSLDDSDSFYGAPASPSTEADTSTTKKARKRVRKATSKSKEQSSSTADSTALAAAEGGESDSKATAKSGKNKNKSKSEGSTGVKGDVQAINKNNFTINTGGGKKAKKKAKKAKKKINDLKKRVAELEDKLASPTTAPTETDPTDPADPATPAATPGENPPARPSSPTQPPARPPVTPPTEAAAPAPEPAPRDPEAEKLQANLERERQQNQYDTLRHDLEAAEQRREQAMDEYARLIATQENGHIGRQLEETGGRTRRFLRRAKSFITNAPNRGGVGQHDNLDNQIAAAKLTLDRSNEEAAMYAGATIDAEYKLRGVDVKSQAHIQMRQAVGFYGHALEIRALNSRIQDYQIGARGDVNRDQADTTRRAATYRWVTEQWSRRGPVAKGLAVATGGAAIGLTGGLAAGALGLGGAGTAVFGAGSGYVARNAGRRSGDFINRNLAATEAGIAARETETDRQIAAIKLQYDLMYDPSGNYNLAQGDDAGYRDRFQHTDHTEQHATSEVRANRSRRENIASIAGLSAVAGFNADSIIAGAKRIGIPGIDIDINISREPLNLPNIDIDIPKPNFPFDIDITRNTIPTVTLPDGSLADAVAQIHESVVCNTDIPSWPDHWDIGALELPEIPTDINLPEQPVLKLIDGIDANLDLSVDTAATPETAPDLATVIDPGDGITNIADEVVNLQGHDYSPQQACDAYRYIIDNGINPNEMLYNPDSGAMYETYKIDIGPYAGQYGILDQQGVVSFTPEAQALLDEFTQTLSDAGTLQAA